jgi:hypothetical protein
VTDAIIGQYVTREAGGRAQAKSFHRAVSFWWNWQRTALMLPVGKASHSCKFLIPKKSGILRPYTILTVEDQIVYQALVNVIAERLAPKMRNSYLTQTFGHIYAGKTSQWFYRRWNDGYKAFNQATRAAFNRGLVYAASFDLTACYDSLDHAVLCHFLTQLGIEQEF